jgi:hypothetical protein
MAEQTQCPNGHASTGDGQCNISSCAHCDPIVNAPTKRKTGLDFGSARDHGVHKRGGRQ